MLPLILDVLPFCGPKPSYLQHPETIQLRPKLHIGWMHSYAPNLGRPCRLVLYTTQRGPKASTSYSSLSSICFERRGEGKTNRPLAQRYLLLLLPTEMFFGRLLVLKIWGTTCGCHTNLQYLHFRFHILPTRLLVQFPSGSYHNSYGLLLKRL